jgi:hypothetical protein
MLHTITYFRKFQFLKIDRLQGKNHEVKYIFLMVKKLLDEGMFFPDEMKILKNEISNF